LKIEEDWLVDSQGMDREKAMLLARISDGSPGRALELEEGGFLEKRREALLSLDKVQRSSPEEALSWAALYEKKLGRDERQEAMVALLGLWKSWYRDLLVLKAEGPEDALINGDLSRELKIAAEASRINTLVSNLQVLEEAERDLLRFRNQELVLENAVLHLLQNRPESRLS
jgi:hypothetical protein